MMRVLNVLRGVGWVAPMLLVGVLAIVTVPWWGEGLLSRLSYFRVRRVEVYGRHYLQPDDVIARLRIDTTASVWSDLHALEQRVAMHPQVRTVEIERKLPGTLIVRVTENLPVAFVPASEGLRAVDADGRMLPIDPTRVNVDLPVLVRPDRGLLHLLADVRGRSPELFDQISNARRSGRDEVALELSSVLVRAPAGVSAERLADIVPVENDLTRRGARVAELDLRFRDQVIARLQ